VKRAYVEPPVEWERLDARGFGPFVTHATFRRPDGVIVTWESRRHRKRARRARERRDSTWFAPSAVGWWIGVLFMVGSACFALGALPGYVHLVGVRADNVTYFIGSLFFTSAGYLQFFEVVNAPRAIDGDRTERRRFVSWDPGRIDWCSTAVQSVGTLAFNISTGSALLQSLDSQQVHRLVWAPDMFGSACFLVASGLSWAEVSHGRLLRPVFTISGWIAMLNLVGSIAFGVSAVAAKVVHGATQPRNIELVNLGTFVGAICFLVGAALLLPERTEHEPAATGAPAPT
jgi:hypothetical protein